ncbi:NUDIX domain-containing protein [Roseisolibacter sp. H3M3-2]|uniref:NUDIX hydrolase n=1 Tax=Roseisolibacter sp. H3M3-2 TaxID=3031323 RepID=UPI0023DC2A3E|nr:NUDIX domain-containing protein [Roseisolibacter sp. H3M3-2]MDF1505302.1 NUDIX domain-containing protein [Roseisolibacter sp. H3M3-2]
MSDYPELRVGVVDVYVVCPRADGWRVLVLQRAAAGTRCPLAWEAVHGRIEPGERPEQAALREVAEETGLRVARLYNVTTQAFYLHGMGVVQLAVAFCAFVDAPDAPALGPEHGAFAWLSPGEARARFVWPREREALDHVLHLLGGGDAGPLEDVLRVV